MKTKTWLVISVLSAVPLMLSAMVNMIASMTYWKGLDVDLSKVNHPFMLWGSILAWFFVVITLITNLIMIRYADDIDSLVEAKKEWNEARKKMEIARDKYTALLSEGKEKIIN